MQRAPCGPGTPIKAPWQGRVHLIDLHRLGHHPWTWCFWQVKDLAQLLFSSELEGIDERDRLRFWHAYLGHERRTRSARWTGASPTGLSWGSFGWLLRRCVLAKCRRYRRHNEGSGTCPPVASDLRS